MVHFMRNVLARVSPAHPMGRRRAQSDLRDGVARIGVGQGRDGGLRNGGARKLKEAAKCLREGIGETTTYLLADYPSRAPPAHPHQHHDSND
jgi:hypothetical protein